MNRLYKTVVKPLFDRVLALILIILLSPLILILSCLLAIQLKGSPFFVQGRLGYPEKAFNLIKLKTMLDTRDDNGELLPDNERLTWVGKKVRDLSLDELPQLINILKGDMSFIGPRPFILEYRELYTAEEMRRHSVKPGITGWAQVNGRNAISWKEKFALDLYYVDNQSFGLDLRIILMTIKKVLARDDVNTSDTVTMEKYNGHN